MKIAVLTRSTPFHKGSGGMERVSWDLACEWARQGHEVEMITTPVPELPSDLPIAIRELNGKSGKYSRKWFSQTLNAVKSVNPDIVFGVSAAAHAVAGRVSVPVVMQAHGTALDEIRTKLRVRTLKSFAGIVLMARALVKDLIHYRRYDFVVAVGPRVEQSLATIGRRVAMPQARRFENPVSTSSFAVNDSQQSHKNLRQELCIESAAPIAVALGRLHREKGVDVAIRALLMWPGELVVVGDGPERLALERLAMDLKVADRVVFTGTRNYEEVLQLLSMADVSLVLSRRVEVGYPLSCLESLQMGTPVVVSDLVTKSFRLDDVLPGVVETPLDPTRVASSLIAAADLEASLPDRFNTSEVARRYLELFGSLSEEIVRVD